MCVSTISTVVVVLVVLVQTCVSEAALRGPPQVETKPNLLDSFLPAAMQIMAHLTELMKYDLKPTTAPPYVTGKPTTTTLHPTPPHRPGIFAPSKPPGPQAYFSQKEFNYREYIERLQQPSGYNYFDRYGYSLEEQEPSNLGQLSRDSQSRSFSNSDVVNVQSPYELYFGKGFAEMLMLINKPEPESVPNDIDLQVQDFSRDYDDSNFRSELRQKKVPPTKAYVTLLSLYDLLNKESKKLGLNKYQGYSDRVLHELIESSTGTSAYQLRTVLNRVVERGDTKKPDIVKKIKQLVADLDESGSYINSALRYIPPLVFLS